MNFKKLLITANPVFMNRRAVVMNLLVLLMNMCSNLYTILTFASLPALCRR